MPSFVIEQCRFLHVPKTGGNWVAAVLREQFPDAQRMPKIHTSRQSAPQPELFTFAFVRHPLSWYQSYFSYKQRKGWDPNNNWDDIVRCDSFPEFLETALEKTPRYYSKLLKRFVGPASDEIDFVGRFETLTEDLIRALDLAGEQFDAEKIRGSTAVNQSNYQQHPADYNDDLARRVLDVEAEVIERFYSGDVSPTS